MMQAPPPPPGKGPGLPPPPPPAGLSAEQKAEIQKVKEEAQRLKDAADGEDDVAATNLRLLIKKHDDEYSHFQREQYNPVQAQIKAIRDPKGKLDQLKETHAALKKGLEAKLKDMERRVAEYRAQRKELEAVAGMDPSILAEIDKEVILLGQESERITNVTLKEVQEQLVRDTEKLNTELNALVAQKRALDGRSKFLKEKKDALDAFKPKKVAGSEAQRDPISVASWAEKGIVKGIFYYNLRNFMVLEDEKDEVENKYTPRRVYDVYTKLARQPGFDETVIMAIAAGLRTRAEGEYCANHNIPSKFLGTTKINPARQAVFEYLLKSLYKEIPNLAQTAADDTFVPAAPGGAPQAVPTLNVEAILDRMADMSAPAAPKAPGATPRGSASSTVAAPSLAAGRKGKDIADEQQKLRDAAEVKARADNRKLEEEMKKMSPADLAKFADKAAAGVASNIKMAQKGLADLDVLAKGLADIESFLAIEVPDDVKSDTIGRVQFLLSSAKERIEELTTPENILNSKRVDGFEEACELYMEKNGGNMPPQTVMVGWGKSMGLSTSERPAYQAKLREAHSGLTLQKIEDKRKSAPRPK